VECQDPPCGTCQENRHGTFSASGHVGGNDYAAGLRTQDGTLGVVYTPVCHTLTIVLSSFAGLVTARWYDPSADTFTNISGSPFPNGGSHNFTTPGNNSVGDPDWALLLPAALGSPTPTPTAHNNNTCADSHACCNAYSNIHTWPQRHTKTYCGSKAASDSCA